MFFDLTSSDLPVSRCLAVSAAESSIFALLISATDEPGVIIVGGVKDLLPSRGPHLVYFPRSSGRGKTCSRFL